MQSFEREVLERCSADSLTDDDSFCQVIGEIQREFLAIHPFREGNARTLKLMTDLLAAQSGRPILLYDMSDAGKRQYIDSAKAALQKKDYQPMVKIIGAALSEARKQP